MCSVHFVPVVGSISDSNLRADIFHSLRCQTKPGSTRRMPLKLSVSLTGHTKAVNCVDWSQSHGQYLLFYSFTSQFYLYLSKVNIHLRHLSVLGLLH